MGSQVEFLKVGGFFRSERVQKINRLIEIEKYLADNNMISSDENTDWYSQAVCIEIPVPEKYMKIMQQSEENKTFKKK